LILWGIESDSAPAVSVYRGILWFGDHPGAFGANAFRLFLSSGICFSDPQRRDIKASGDLDTFVIPYDNQPGDRLCAEPAAHR